MIGAVYGVVYIEVNAGSLPTTMMLILRVLGAAVFLLVLSACVWRARNMPSRPTGAGWASVPATC
jgi:hypothetical protein